MAPEAVMPPTSIANTSDKYFSLFNFETAPDGSGLLQSGDILIENNTLRIARNTVDSKQIKSGAIEADDIDANTVTGKIIRDGTITGKDISKNAKITVKSLTVSGGTTNNGDLDMGHNVVTNIGSSGSNFTSTGGLNLNGNLLMTSDPDPNTIALSVNGGSNAIGFWSGKIFTNSDVEFASAFIANKLTVDDGGTYTKKGNILHVKNEVVETSGTVVDTSRTLFVEQLNPAGTGATVNISSHSVAASALRIDADTETMDVMRIYADALSTGSAALFSSDSLDPSSRSLVDIVNDNTAAVGTTALRVQQDSTGSIASFFDGHTQVFSILDGGNIGIRTTSQFGSGSGVLAFGNAAVNPTTALTNAALLYASGGELYAYDAAGNATQISPHDQDGLWYYYSENTKTGKTLEISMEALMKDIDQILGGGYVFENGAQLFSGENKITSLVLKTNKNTSALDGLESSMDNALSTKNVVDGVSNTLNNTINTLSSQGKDVDALKERMDIAEGIQREQGLLLGTLQDQMTLMKEQNQSITDFLLAVNSDTLLYKDVSGDLRLPDAQIEAKGVSAEAFTVQAQSGTKSPTIGQATVPAGKQEVVVETAGVRSGSKVFVSFTSDLEGRNYFIAEKKKGQSFTVELSDPVASDVSFDWWIVNENEQ